MGANAAWRVTGFVLRVKQWTDESKRHKVWVAVLTWSCIWIWILRVDTLTGGHVCWGVCHFFFSGTQKSATLSFTEAEYVAMAAGVKETTFCGISGALYSRTATLDAL